MRKYSKKITVFKDNFFTRKFNFRYAESSDENELDIDLVELAKLSKAEKKKKLKEMLANAGSDSDSSSSSSSSDSDSSSSDSDSDDSSSSSRYVMTPKLAVPSPKSDTVRSLINKYTEKNKFKFAKKLANLQQIAFFSFEDVIAFSRIFMNALYISKTPLS